MEGYTISAQKFAATHRIPLIEFDKMPFWENFEKLLNYISKDISSSEEMEKKVLEFADYIGARMSVAITNSGQMLFLYREIGKCNQF